MLKIVQENLETSLLCILSKGLKGGCWKELVLILILYCPNRATEITLFLPVLNIEVNVKWCPLFLFISLYKI